MQRLFLEREDANSESATLVAWLVADGETVQRHQRICVLETTKATIDMVAPQPGILRHRYPEGSEIAFGTTLGWILEAGEDSPDPEDTRETGAAGAAETAGLQISRAAARLIEEAGIDPTAIREHGFITEKEVRRHMARSRRQAAPPHPALADIDLEAVSLPPGLGQDDHGRLDPVFLSRLREEGERFRRLHPGEKLQAYRKHGAAIAEDVHLGPGSLLIAPRLVIGPGSRIGAETTADCAEQLAIGALSHFGPGLTVRARCAVFGDNVHAGRGITIGGGGHRDPWAVFAAGNLTFIGDEVFINVCRAVLLGREVFLTMRSIIVTHNIGHSPPGGLREPLCPGDPRRSLPGRHGLHPLCRGSHRQGSDRRLGLLRSGPGAGRQAGHGGSRAGRRRGPPPGQRRPPERTGPRDGGRVRTSARSPGRTGGEDRRRRRPPHPARGTAP
ncbi:MAG: biotin/lipoyl-containing protein [Acidobacteriota bacterium]|nr:biotin/lipoyl-containing protein [Acidobacteriota bacterium]